MGEFTADELHSLVQNYKGHFRVFFDDWKRVNKKLENGDDFTDDEASILRRIKALVGKLEPKPNSESICYFAASLSPIEIWRLNIKGDFYVPNFIVAMDTIKDLPDLIDANVIVEVVLDYNQFAVVLQPGLFLISCYNVFAWENYRQDEEGRMIIRIRSLNYHFANKGDKVATQRALKAKTFSGLEDNKVYLNKCLDPQELYEATNRFFRLYPIADQGPIPSQPKGNQRPPTFNLEASRTTGIYNL